MAVTEVPDDLASKLKSLNQARDRTIVGALSGVPGALNAARKGGDVDAAATRYLPKGNTPTDPMAVASMKKDIIIQMAKDQEDVRAGKLSLAAAFQKGNDMVEKILGASASFGGAQAAAFASVKNNVRDNITSAGNNTSDAVVKALGTVDEGSSAAVSRALDSLRAMMAPGGTVGPEFSAALSSQLTAMPDARGRAYLLEALNQDPSVQAQGGLRPVLQGMQGAGDEPAGNALRVWEQNQTFVDEATQRVANLPMAIWASTIEQMSGDGTLGAGALGKNIEEITGTLRELGLAEDPAERERIFDKLMGSMRPDDKDPDAQKKFDELLGQLDKPTEQLDPTRRQAKSDLMKSEQFQAWMQQNGFQDPDTALTALRQRMRKQTSEARQSDDRLMKATRDASPDTDFSPPSAGLTDKQAQGGKAPDAQALEPGVVMGKDGMPVFFTGTELVPLSDEALAKLDAEWEADPKTRDAFNATSSRYGEYEGAVAKAAPAAAVTDGVPKTALDPAKEAEFKTWYGSRASKLGLDPNPDAPEHHYDYRAAFLAGAEPGPDAHWPSEFKDEGHPNRFVDGQDTITGLSAPAPNLGQKLMDSTKQTFAGLFDAGKKKREEERKKKLEAAGLATEAL